MTQQQLARKKRTIQQKATQQVENPQLSGRVPGHTYLPAQSIFGNHGVLRRYGSDVIQAKLNIGSPNDKYEQEADRIAKHTMRVPETWTQKRAEEEDREPFQGNQVSGGNVEAGPELEARINVPRRGGQPIPSSTRTFFEWHFGYDFSHVRIHADKQSDMLNRTLNARAFTTGQHILFRQQYYRPGTSTGQALLAHELIHVIQQSASETAHKGIVQRQEDEADESKMKQKLIENVGKLVEDSFSQNSEMAFKHYDKNGDGGLDASELTELLVDAQVCKKPLCRTIWVPGILKNLDTNGNKKIEWAEFQTVAGSEGK